MSDFEFHRVEGGAPIKMWTHGVQVEEKALHQVENVSKLPFIHDHIAIMPDVHWSMGATIGSVIPTKGAIVPAAVGVDIGCGMMAFQTTLRASQLPDSLHQTRLDIEKAVPHGRTDNGGLADRGSWHDLPYAAVEQWRTMEAEYGAIIAKHPKAKTGLAPARHIGTLGTGNHFIELCLDENDFVWATLHSGSRGVGNKIGSYFIERAKEEMRRYYIDKFIPDQDLSYLVEHTELFDDYVQAVSWAQEFARANRSAMMMAVLQAMGNTLPEFAILERINCHHNYIARENHFNSNVIVTRKGAVRARKDDLGIIPGSMGTGSFIVRGKGNPDSFCSCSHGAGRAMSRGAAVKAISLEDHAKAMVGIEARLDAEVLDESPAAYKPIGAVMAAQDSLIEIVHRLRQVLNVKG